MQPSGLYSSFFFFFHFCHWNDPITIKDFVCPGQLTHTHETVRSVIKFLCVCLCKKGRTHFMWAPHGTIHNDCHQCVNWSATGSCEWKWKWQTVVPTARWEDIPRALLLSPVVWYCDSSLRFSLRPFSLLWSYSLPGILCTQSPMMSVCLSTCYGNGRKKGTKHNIIHNTRNGHGVRCLTDTGELLLLW